MNKKGFTLIELLATIIILSIITTVTVVTVTSMYKNSKDKAEEIFEKELTNMIDDYITLHTSTFKNGGTMTLNDLIIDRMTTQKDLVNPKTKTNCNINTSITVKRTENRGYCFENVNLTCATIESC